MDFPSDFAPSPHFNFVRARQLEGTYPGDLRQGVWTTTSHRISKGWGQLPYVLWPRNDRHGGDSIPGEPPDADLVAKRYRLLTRYQRLHSEAECVKALAVGRFVGACLDVRTEWIDPPAGRIELVEEGGKYLGSHFIFLASPPLGGGELFFPNTWGIKWGERGYGYLPSGYLDRFGFDFWTLEHSLPLSRHADGQGIREYSFCPPQCLSTIPYQFEIFDEDHDELVGWCFVVARDSFLDVEELFVKPNYRRRGFGGRLADLALKHSSSLGLPIRMWVPWGDHEAKNAPALLAIARRLRLYVGASGVRWAAFKCVNGPTPERLPHLEWMPDRPALVNPSSSRSGELVSSIPAFKVAIWDEAKDARRDSLIEKKYTVGLTAAESDEFEHLKLDLSRYLSVAAPLPFGPLDSGS